MKGLEEINLNHTQCRTWAHCWMPYDAKRDGSSWIADLRCIRCQSHRLDTINKRGEVTKRTYRMASGYLRKGEGPLTADGRADLRVKIMTSGGYKIPEGDSQ